MDELPYFSGEETTGDDALTSPAFAEPDEPNDENDYDNPPAFLHVWKRFVLRIYLKISWARLGDVLKALKRLY